MRIEVDKISVKIALAKNGDTYRSFSDRSGISISYFSSIMNSHSNPSPKMAKRICHYLQKDFDELFYIQDSEVKEHV